MQRKTIVAVYDTHEQAKDARLNYARLLVAAKRYPEARKQFEVLLEQFPQNADPRVGVFASA